MLVFFMTIPNVISRYFRFLVASHHSSMPDVRFADVANYSSEDGSMIGSLEAVCGSEGVASIIHSTIESVTGTFRVDRLNVWLDSCNPVPHLIMEYGTTPFGKSIAYLDILPRVDLAINPEYVSWFYSTIAGDVSRVNFDTIPYVKALRSPAAYVAIFPKDDFEAIESTKVRCKDLFTQWYTWLGSTPYLVRDDQESRDRAKRDRLLRDCAIENDPGNAYAKQWFGDAKCERLLLALKHGGLKEIG
jgi:hypothetical protein